MVCGGAPILLHSLLVLQEIHSQPVDEIGGHVIGAARVRAEKLHKDLQIRNRPVVRRRVNLRRLTRSSTHVMNLRGLLHRMTEAERFEYLEFERLHQQQNKRASKPLKFMILREISEDPVPSIFLSCAFLRIIVKLRLWTGPPRQPGVAETFESGKGGIDQ